MTQVLEVSRLSKRFGGVAAVNDVSFSLQSGQIVGLIGPNGAGKTTLVNLITGVTRPSSGTVHFLGEDVTGQRPWQASRRGLARTFQIVQPFPQMSVIDNVAAGALFGGQVSTPRQARDLAMELLKRVGLFDVADRSAMSLTLPSRKRLELAKSLAMRPKVLLLDEVNAGLNSAEILQAIELIRDIAREGITILIIEHLMKVVFSLCDRLLVLHQGALICDGAPKSVASDPRVVSAYLGHRYAGQGPSGKSIGPDTNQEPRPVAL
jgi:branched-chain amino acid transport system ATP-binding protein